MFNKNFISMKKALTGLFLMVMVTVGFFTSCTPDVLDSNPPTISITSPTADTTKVFIGDSVTFSISLSSENGLASFKALSSVSGVEITNGNLTFSGTSSEKVSVTATLSNAVTAGTVIEISFVVEDSKKSASEKKVLVAKAKETPLSEAKNFEWKRVGGTTATGLETFGLTWTSNSTELNAVIKKGATKFVELEPATWTTIANLEALKTAIDGATDIDKWEKVSASSASKTYDLTLGTIKDSHYFLIHVTNSTVSVADAGTTVTINGQYKE
jgi:hypothetical protein